MAVLEYRQQLRGVVVVGWLRVRTSARLIGHEGSREVRKAAKKPANAIWNGRKIFAQQLGYLEGLSEVDPVAIGTLGNYPDNWKRPLAEGTSTGQVTA